MTDITKFPETLQLVDAVQLRQLIEHATNAPRKRAHLLLHSGPDDQVQRLLIAVQPGTYVRPHQHSRQWEMLVLHSGCLDILIFKGDGELLSRKTLDQTSPVAQILASNWHACVVRAPDTIVLEIKPGPYMPNEFADWSPEEGHEQAVELLHWNVQAKLGQKWLPTRAKSAPKFPAPRR